MSQAIRYEVIFKDGPHEIPLFIGPFVSLSAAENFKLELPKPLPGGKVTVREMYGHETIALIKDLIRRNRQPKSLT